MTKEQKEFIERLDKGRNTRYHIADGVINITGHMYRNTINISAPIPSGVRFVGKKNVYIYFGDHHTILDIHDDVIFDNDGIVDLT